VALIDVNNKIHFREQLVVPGSQVSIPTANIVPGFYLLRIEHDDEVHNIKVIKSN
jgi:hypothetical protein